LELYLVPLAVNPSVTGFPKPGKTVAERRQFFALMTPEMLSKCTQGLYTVCPSDIVLRTAGEPNCLIALFLGKADIMFSKWKRLILHESFEPIWIRSPDSNYWIYSLSTPQRITMQCQETGSPSNSKQSYSVIIQGTGILPNLSSCYIYAEGFKLLPHSLGKTTVFLDRTQIVLPNIENLLNSLEETSLLQLKGNQPIDLPKLDSIIERAASRSQTRGINVGRLTEMMQGDKGRHRPDVWLWVTSTAVVILSIAIVWLIRLKLAKMYCFRRRHDAMRSRHTSGDCTTHALSTCDVELQNQPEQEGGVAVKLESNTSVREQEIQEVLTRFVLRGQVTEGLP
jgi:hypothetical protein